MKILQNKKLLVGIFLIIVVAASGGTYYYLNQQKPTPFEQKTEMPKFKSCDSFIKAYKEGSKRSSGPLMMESAPGSANKSAPLAAEGRGGGSEAPEHSETNIQVAGVDEADIVKNDGKYIYTISGSSVFILNAYPPEEAKVVGKIEYDKESSGLDEMFIDGNRLTVIGSS